MQLINILYLETLMINNREIYSYWNNIMHDFYSCTSALMTDPYFLVWLSKIFPAIYLRYEAYVFMLISSYW
jgi:hypothetical protein